MTNIDPFIVKVTLCADVVWALMSGFQEDIEAAVGLLKNEFGSHWSTTTAVQFMSGKDAHERISRATTGSKSRLLGAHNLARIVSSELKLGEVQLPDGIDLAELKATMLAEGVEFPFEEKV
ncbi:MAG: hypothetical protein QM533_05020 [Cytophagales bacterium]|nr:hypothetical protein [Cytophagales bacterium]